MVLAASGPPKAPQPGGNHWLGTARWPLRVGIVNVMPRAETYEANILRPLARAVLPVTPVWIRLRSHSYGSSDPDYIHRAYVDFEDAIGAGILDGLILTGAPVEDLEFHEVHYWTELVEILRFCRSHVASVLGLCWGGLALAKLLNIEKRNFETKLFGVFQNRNLASDHPILGGADEVFWCVHSRHSGVSDSDLEGARDAGVVHLLAHGPETGYSIFESSDRRFLMHLGHPEYGSTRLLHEWERDASLGRRDVDPPRNFDLERPVNIWQSHCNDLFSQWLRDIALRRVGNGY
ncbi:MAG: homoserine O-succinyltransferase [Polyangiaceae bacterium]|jgi:homoserine O-succinyltransferase